jgi:hypothetical protein
MQIQHKESSPQPFAFIVRFQSDEDEVKAAPIIRRIAPVQYTGKERTAIINARQLEELNRLHIKYQLLTPH